MNNTYTSAALPAATALTVGDQIKMAYGVTYLVLADVDGLLLQYVAPGRVIAGAYANATALLAALAAEHALMA